MVPGTRAASVRSERSRGDDGDDARLLIARPSVVDCSFFLLPFVPGRRASGGARGRHMERSAAGEDAAASGAAPGGGKGDGGGRGWGRGRARRLPARAPPEHAARRLHNLKPGRGALLGDRPPNCRKPGDHLAPRHGGAKRTGRAPSALDAGFRAPRKCAYKMSRPRRPAEGEFRGWCRAVLLVGAPPRGHRVGNFEFL